MKQKVEELPLFPVRTWQFRAPLELADKTEEMARGLNYKCYNNPGGVGTCDDIHELEEWHDLMAWFQSCVDTLHAQENWHCDRLVINKAWVNRSDAKSGDRHHPHRHPMSYLSGIYYITAASEAPTVFLDPLDKREWAGFHLDGGPIDNQVFYHGGRGGLILFPSWLVHATVENYSDVDRYSIALNTFPTGDINFGGWDKPMAKVKVQGWKEDIGALNLSEYK